VPRQPPKGTFVHNPPSFFLRNMAAAQHNTGALALGQIGAVGLFNNSIDGKWLVVWDVYINVFPNTPGSSKILVDGTLVNGFVQSVGLANTGSPLVSGGAQPDGLCFADRPNQESGLLFFSDWMPAGGYHWPHDWPFCAIQPGFSCEFFTDANAYQEFGVSFIYEVVSGNI
jgi:hypothetical protein